MVEHARRPAEGAPFDTLVHIDIESGTSRAWEPGEGQFVLEPVFVPRTVDAPEGDGYIVTAVYDQARNLSDFVVLDTDDISRGPVGRAELPVRIPYGFHGNWRDLR